MLSIVVGLGVAAGAVYMLLPDEDSPHTHQYVETIVKSATCDENGEVSLTCECGDTYTERTAALGHAKVQHNAQAATCTAIGWNAYETCSRCDYTTYVEIPAKGHTYGDWVETDAPTCTEKGEERRDCDNCDHYETREVAALGHTYGTWIDEIPATCEGEGMLGHYNCSDYKRRNCRQQP